MAQRPFAWEKSYPPGVRWDAPIETSPIPAILARGLAIAGDGPAFEFRDRRISYRDLAEVTDRVASGLLRRGIGPGVAVALFLPNTPVYPIAFFGILKAGARAVNLSPLDAIRELAYKLLDSGARVLIATNWSALLPRAEELAKAGHLDMLIVADDAEWGPPLAPLVPMPESGIVPFSHLMRETQRRPLPAVSVDDVALLQYTGGTTGVPKGAMLTHGNISATVSMYHAWNELEGDRSEGRERVICVLPLFHIYGLSSVMLRNLCYGNELLLRDKFDVETTLRDIEEKRATAFPGVPTMWFALAGHPGIEKRDLSSLKYCGSGGAPMPIEIAQRVERLIRQRVGGGWGMSETAPAGTRLPRHAPQRAGCIGLPLPGIEMDVASLEDPRRVLPPGEFGEIRIKGANVMKGYWNRPEETAAAFVDGFFLTGDLGYMDEHGYFFLIDRKKDMIISGGFNVYPRVIEEAIYEHPDVEEAIVIGIPDAHRGEAAKAFLRMRPGAKPLTLDELRAFLADKVGRHEMPAALEIRDALPRTAVGKLSKKELVEEERRKAALAKAPEPAEHA